MKEILPSLVNASSWDDIYDHFCAKYEDKISCVGKDFEIFAKLYFLCEPEVRQQYKNVWFFSETPPQIKARLGLNNQDYGIDLILEDQENFLHVVQCKFKKDQESSVSWTKDKLANVLAEGDKADFFIIFTNASRIDTHTLSKKKNRLRVFTVGNFLHISPQTIKSMQNYLLENRPIKQPKKLPRDYQKTAIDKVIEGFKQNGRGQLILPCGTGKTLISLWIQEQMNPRHTLVLFPSLALLRQTKNEWAANREKYVPYICVCSEKDIDKKGDNPQVHLYEMSGVVSTDPDEIRFSLNKHKQLIVFSTYQSLGAVAKAVEGTEIVFDLAFCDEAHKTAGNRKGLYGLIHDDSIIPVKKRLYMTATPRVLGENVRNRLNEEEVGYLADMSDVKTFGHEFHHMSFKQAIEQDILVDYKIVAMGVSDLEIAAAIKERRFVEDDVTADEIVHNYALEKFMKKYQSSHAITFHSSVSKAQNFKERHQEFFADVEIFHVNGNQTTNDRNVTLKAFEKSSKSVVTNARCLTEGVDIPVIDAVYFCDPKNSKIDIVQAAGRALRRADHRNKTLGYIVVPIFHYNRDSVEESIEEGVFNNLINVIRSLSSHDERLVDEIRAVKMGGGVRQPQSDHISIVDAVNLITIEEMGDLKDHLFDQVISKFRLPWRPFEEARTFVHTLGLKNKAEWEDYCRSGDKPEDIPAIPGKSYAYANKGWVDLGHWLGTGFVSTRLRKYRPFEEARSFIHTLGLKNSNGWRTYCRSGKKPEDIPQDPRNLYKDDGWQGMSNWLGRATDRTARRWIKYKTFEEARAWVHTLALKDREAWQKFCKSVSKPADIPHYPDRFYENEGWDGWGGWLGTFRISNKKKKENYLDFEEAREFVRTLGLKRAVEWQKYCKDGGKPKNIPTNPDKVYSKKGWQSMGDWLGTFRVSNRKKNENYLNFEEAREFVRTLGLKSAVEWQKYCKNNVKPGTIPPHPHKYYKNNGWMDWGDWLGTGRTADQKRKYKFFDEARSFVNTLKLSSWKEWRKYCNSGARPEDIPAKPNRTYANKGWISVGDWLGKLD